jgi:hypothetical protein
VQGQVEDIDEGRKRHAVDAVSVYSCWTCVTRSQGRTRLTVGAMDGTAGYPRTAKFLQFGGRFDSERGALARIHIPQLSKRLCGAGWCLRGPQRKCGVWAGRFVGRLSGRFGACSGLLYSCCQWRSLGRAVCVDFWRGCEVECAGNGRGGGISI